MCESALFDAPILIPGNWPTHACG
ncbi:MAG: hypothetical protein RL307_1534, partial [Pseudomonadota bacterium]